MVVSQSPSHTVSEWGRLLVSYAVASFESHSLFAIVCFSKDFFVINDLCFFVL